MEIIHLFFLHTNTIRLKGKILCVNISVWNDWTLDPSQSSIRNQLYYLNYPQLTVIIFSTWVHTISLKQKHIFLIEY